MSNEREKTVLKLEKRFELVEDQVKAGIECNRKGLFFIQVKDSVTGKNIPGVKLTARQITHDFHYGANLFMLDEFDQPEQNDAYKKYFADAFNMATLPFYWSDLEPVQGQPRYGKDSPKIYRRPAPDLCLEYCEANGIEPKAHCLNYDAFTPWWVKEKDLAEQKKLLNKRFRELAERYADRIRDWEVTNETMWGYGWHSAFYDEPDFVEWSFKCADRYFPCNRLAINEAHSRIFANDQFFGTRSAYYQQIDRAIGQGARIDSIAMQFHMFYRAEAEAQETDLYYDPARLLSILDVYHRLQRPIHISEMTIPAYSYKPEDEEFQARIMRVLYSTFFSHPAMDGIMYWNLIDGFAAFAPQGDMNAGENYYHGGMIRYDFTEKPSFKLVRDLFKKEWCTGHAEAETDFEGIARFRGFYGKYEIEVTDPDGRTARQIVHCEKTVCGPRIVVI